MASAGLPAFAAQRRRDVAGKSLAVDRLTGFCLLARREVLDRIGYFDEGFGTGFFEDDDLSVRAVRAGFRLLVAQDTYIHHFGSRTFTAPTAVVPGLRSGKARVSLCLIVTLTVLSIKATQAMPFPV